MFYNRSNIRSKDVTDGLSRTFAIGEVIGDRKGSYSGYFWTSWNLVSTRGPINYALQLLKTATYKQDGTVESGHFPWSDTNAQLDDLAPPPNTSFASYHPGGCHFLLADGSVRFVTQDISRNLLRALSTRNGEEMTDDLR